MTRKIRITPVVGIFALVCAAAALLPAGCESSNRVVSVEPSETCPLCERVTRIQPLTGLKYTTVVCPTCEHVYTLDPQVLNAIERFTGPNIGDRVHVCDSCGRIIEDCAACREKRVSRGG